ncbi:MAG: site-2 protease family protein, partial [Candidatus Nanoarchaeia archaeon]
MNIIEQLLTGLFVFLLFGLCIFVHELGHFLVAKWRGLYIVAFSIGFKKIWAFKRGGVEYRIGALPFGGYVDLPQLEPGAAEILTPDGKPLPPAKPSDRILAALAGPLFNILFGALIGIVLWIHGIPLDSPKMRSFEVSYVDEESPEYKAGLRKGDIVYEINGKKFYKNWSGIVEDILFTIGDVTLSVKRGQQDIKIQYTPAVNTKQGKLDKIAYPFFKPKVPLVVNRFKKSSPAEKAGMQKNDMIIAI